MYTIKVETTYRRADGAKMQTTEVVGEPRTIGEWREFVLAMHRSDFSTTGLIFPTLREGLS